MCRWGMQAVDGNGGVRAAVVWRLRMDQMDPMNQMDQVGAPQDTPWVCVPLCVLARVIDVPVGYKRKRRRDSKEPAAAPTG